MNEDSQISEIRPHPDILQCRKVRIVYDFEDSDPQTAIVATRLSLGIYSTTALPLLGDPFPREIFAEDGPVRIPVANLVVAADKLELCRKVFRQAAVLTRAKGDPSRTESMQDKVVPYKGMKHHST